MESVPHAPREMSAAVALLNSAPPSARAGPVAPAYLVDTLLGVAVHQTGGGGGGGGGGSLASSATSSAASSARSLGAPPPDTPPPESEDGTPLIECIATVNPTTVLMLNQEKIDKYVEEGGGGGAGGGGGGALDAGLTIQTAKILALKKNRVTDDDVRRVSNALRYAFSNNFSRAEVHHVPRDDLQIFCESANEPFKTGDAQPRVGSKTWHIMSWLAHDQQTRCVLARATGTKFFSPVFAYSLIADASAFERAADASATSELAGLRARLASAETQLRTKSDMCAALERAITDKAARIKRGVAENDVLRREVACYKELAGRTQAEAERLLAENAALVGERDALLAATTPRRVGEA